MRSTKDVIEDAKARVEEATKHHVLTCEVSTPSIKSYLYKQPGTGTYWMRAIETPYGLHLEGDVGCLQICYKTFGWLASGDSIDYQMSKLDHDLHKKDEVSSYKVKSLVEDMIRHIWDNRSYRRDKILARQNLRLQSRKPSKVTLFTEEERDFFQELKDYGYEPDWTVEQFYKNIYDLSGWEDYCSDGLNIEDYSWSTYFKFFCLKKVAKKVIEYETQLQETLKVFDNLELTIE